MGCVECVHPQKPCPGLDAETGGDGKPRGTSPRVFLLPSTGAPKPVGSPSCPPPTSCPAAGAAACLEETRPACAGCAVCSLSVVVVTRRAARGWPAGRAPSALPSKAEQVQKLPPGPPGQLRASRLRVSGSLPSPKRRGPPGAPLPCPAAQKEGGVSAEGGSASPGRPGPKGQGWALCGAHGKRTEQE